MNNHEPPALWEEALDGEPVTLRFPGFPPVQGTGPAIYGKSAEQRISELRAIRDADPVDWQDSDHNDDALELAELEEKSTDTLADQVVELARIWAGNDPERLREAEQILATTRYLEGGKRWN
jgi:hypothetical protein